ncbi:molybdopterin-dependent oxidoreductase alpha subunit [Microbacterium endophyticum]|uniref:Molybdopterin-dependent oxidoreductase alpha subunit n=1 Tax=Microbacterium endophyticum TaxID=1526412 RepID=A0A7W4V4K3_9MICO|nr:FdhF/YdeP family oxidoreductase [Microbacterium endophyticum]MBB2976589.1 molybdopterin-dependent oxidoreductase alpha subunit [Microbacterium endophyticum]NIK37528.1 molybdopterin-dependent oxidoreductase alpha subunit [Microbacterium endophyticum]
MASKPPKTDIDETRLRVTNPKTVAVGIPGVAHAMETSLSQMGVVRTAQTLLRVNQKDGFDCPGCAWPETDHRHVAEFCENGAKAVAEEATVRRVAPDFFAEHSVADLAGHDDWWLGQQGRLTHPMILDEGATHYREISWNDALDEIARELRSLADPNEAIFYTSGRTSNEAAFVYQLLVRGFGTNNLPDCSNMCHESSGSALSETIGIGKGTVSIEDVHTAKLLIVAGQNPGTNHPRMLTALEKAKQQGAKIIAINPLPEAGLQRFENPQTPKGMVLGGTPVADQFVQIRLGGDQALFQAVGKYLLEIEVREGGVLDHEFISSHTSGFEAYKAHLSDASWSEFEEATGIDEAQLREVGEAVRQSASTIVCWAMGLTQHKHSVPTLREVVNVLLLQGNIGRAGAGVCPVRGHSNVQGDRTMGIYEKPSEEFLRALDREFAFTAPREHGHDTVGAIRAMRDGKARFFLGMGGNFASATPDTEVTEAALRRLDLTVHISTKLNRSHVVTGKRAIILPTLGRTDRDRRGGAEQKVSVEDSMGAVHSSRGRLAPPAEDLLSEVAIVSRLCELVFGSDRPNAPVADWKLLENDYTRVRAHIEKVVPGFDDFEKRIDKGRTFFLPNGPRDERRFATSDGKAHFTANPLEYIPVPSGRLVLQTLRSHDQYNTTIYGKDDRYRGIHGGRRVVFVNADDITALGFVDGEIVDLVSEWPDADGVVHERRAEGFRIVDYSTPHGNAAAYYPETNVLVPLESVADVSGTPTSKSVVIRLEHRS